MKHLASIILTALLLFSLASCVSLVDSPQESESNIATDSEESSTPDTNNNESDVNKFISKEVKNSWHDSLLSVLAQVGIYDQELDVTGSFAAGLMDLDFDNIPEVILAYHGGSMGNIPLEIYDLNTGEKLDFYSFSHYDRWDNVYLCIAQKGDEYVIIEKGSIRITGADYVYSVGTVKSDRNSESDYIQMSPLFSIENEDEKIIYEYMGKTVDKVEYDAMYQQFLTDYVIIEETQLQLIKWENFGKLEWKDFGYKEGIDPESHRKLAEKMAEALINSSQEFIDCKSAGITMSKYPFVPNMYYPLLDAYVKMSTHKKTMGSTDGIVATDYPELSEELFNALLDYAEEYDSYGRGYFLYDINLDGIEELVFSFYGGYYIEMIFTGDGNEAKLIGRFNNNNYKYFTKIGDDGRIHRSITGKGEKGVTHHIYSFDKTGMTKVFSYGISDLRDYYNYPCELEWLKLENGEWVNITEEEYLELEETYAFNEIKDGFEFRYFFKFAPK